MPVETLLVRTLFESEKYQNRLKFIESNAEPRVGISTFYANKRHWNPGKKHFHMSMEECNCFTEGVAQTRSEV